MSKLSFEAVVMKGFKEIDAFFSAFFDEFSEAYGLSSVQIKAIMEVKLNKAISMKDLCGKLEMSKSNLSPICKKLEGAKFLKKTRDYHDQRIVNLELTEKGEEVVDAIRKRLEEKLEPVFCNLTDDEKNKVLESVSIILEKLK